MKKLRKEKRVALPGLPRFNCFHAEVLAHERRVRGARHGGPRGPEEPEAAGLRRGERDSAGSVYCLY